MNMENEPLVSVGIPCYNRPEGLKRTLECITGQTYKNLEIIVSDNCSPDPEVERVGREYASRNISTILSAGCGKNE
jgi:glycosyltransferase involved in cell wall biosynthesis